MSSTFSVPSSTKATAPAWMPIIVFAAEATCGSEGAASAPGRRPTSAPPARTVEASRNSRRSMGASDRVLLRLAQLPQDAIFDPVRIPPLDRIHHLAADEHGEVQMVAGGEH